MYTILIEQDDSLYGSHKERIMQRSKCVENLVFIVDPIYRNTYDMTNATVMLEYLLPVSKRYKTEYLVLSDERYNDCYLQYRLPLDTNLTSEAGKVELQVTFVYTDLDEHGNGIQRVRKTYPTTIEITPIAAWADIIPDAALSPLDQRLIKLDAQMRAMNDYMNVLDNNKVDDLLYDDKNETLQLMSNGVGIGNKVSVRDMLDDGIPVVSLDSNSGENNDKDNNECDCGCEDNVVEFNDTTTVKPNEENNVVEF